MGERRAPEGSVILSTLSRPNLAARDLLSEAQRQLIRRASALSLTCEAVEADMVRDMAFDIANYITATNALRRVLETLGISRVPRPVSLIAPTIRNPTLRYIVLTMCHKEGSRK
jgi:hypothetical protein